MSDALLATSDTLSVAFVDLAGFTALTDTHGDDHAADLAGRFAQLARATLEPGERLLKTIGMPSCSPHPRPSPGSRSSGTQRNHQLVAL